ncbi:hypothetical protein [Lentibacillus amyloliquefaciens]|uniref:YtxH domain-containing protein n=1 Tax=Lentibacillus amyloliquefaciens TaxID=1472767 RepID=A0A0U4FNF2_9BACI|nr:hypothetical protein [Lentibacillus amyloliquefaciens]ALX47349.1 hypothetical protein AOX59_01275 [Lentibacillus amyloliquefaciens]
MKKRYMASAAGAVGAGIAGYFLRNGQSREKVKVQLKTAADKIKNGKNEKDAESTLEDAGAPDQTRSKDAAQMENSKMVSEGSQFGVNYYNEVKEEKNEKMNN